MAKNRARYLHPSASKAIAGHEDSCSGRLPGNAAFSGLTAAWLHGLDVDPCDPIEITVAAPTTVSTRAGMVVRRRALDRREFARPWRHDAIARPGVSIHRGRPHHSLSGSKFETRLRLTARPRSAQNAAHETH
jgi:hypothetical protein